MLQISNNHECWDTFEAYYILNMNILKKYLYFKFINLGTDEFSNGKFIEYIDYSFVKVYEISKIIFNGQILYENVDNIAPSLTLYLGGIDLKSADGHNEFEIHCRNAQLLIPHTAHRSRELWTPIDTPNISRNMPPEEVLHFINSSIDET